MTRKDYIAGSVITGTSYFVSFPAAIRYYRDYDGRIAPKQLQARVQSKIDAGEIHIGPPTLVTGQTLTVIDDGTRFAIVDSSAITEYMLEVQQ